ncbi:MAG: hypothetical protein LBS21_12045 [Clostridiales bacterium]|jgi:hypothetical protein|nr:hypothetical protein [Clostridiales bacterium]
MDYKAKLINLTPAKCAVDLSDGSERGEYVNQDYILHTLGRPHRAVNLMFCYYPLDDGWPGRASEVHKSDSVTFQWDYPYDDYFPYTGGINGNTEGEPFKSMRDVRAHGQDVILTLTIDPHVPDEHLVQIAKDLSTFGRLMIRINHEATGSWFSFNKRCTYQEVADFYVKFHNIIKKEAPHIQTILCAGGVEDKNSGEVEKEAEFTEAIRATDIWSVDKYLALHYGWPYDVAERGGKSHLRYNTAAVYEFAKRSCMRYKHLCGGKIKPMVMSELNADGDVTGAAGQAEMIKEFIDILKADDERWFSAFTFYQFRDRGRLGLEIEDPNNPDVGIKQPVLDTYKEIIHDPFFCPQIVEKEEINFPVTLRWGGAEDAEGIAVPLHFEKNPVFCEVNFNPKDRLNLMMELNGTWFYKSPNATTIDLMSAFYENPLKGECELTLKIFAPPASGENDPSHGGSWRENYFTKIESLPNIRIRFEPVMDKII